LKIQTTKPEQAVQHGRTRTAVSRRFGRACRRDQRRRRCAQVRACRVRAHAWPRDGAARSTAGGEAPLARRCCRGSGVTGRRAAATVPSGAVWGQGGLGGPGLADLHRIGRFLVIGCFGCAARDVRRACADGWAARPIGRWSGGRCGRPGRGVGATRSPLGVAIRRPRCCRWRP